MSAQLLLVDDEPGLREAVKDYLQESGFTVQVASNAQEGWELVAIYLWHHDVRDD